MKYFKRYWDETTGDDFTESWGTSTYYFETDDQWNVLRQLQAFQNGQILKYDTEYFEDSLGGLSKEPLGEEFESFQISKPEFEQIWDSSYYRGFPEIVITEDCLWGQPRLEGRRLAVGDIVSQVDINNSIYDTSKDYEISLVQIRQALLYCKTLQCMKDAPLKFCHNCTLRIKQDNHTDGEEQDNWKRSDRLFRLHFM